MYLVVRSAESTGQTEQTEPGGREPWCPIGDSVFKALRVDDKSHVHETEGFRKRERPRARGSMQDEKE